MNEKPHIEKTAELVQGGSWVDYFKEKSIYLWDQDEYEKRIDKFYSRYNDFHERHFSNEKGPLLELGTGFGGTALPLTHKGYNVIGLDNDPELSTFCETNNRWSPHPENFQFVHSDLYKPDWHKEFINKGIQGIVSYGVLEHFTEEFLAVDLLPKIFEISPMMIGMIPVGTPQTLEAFRATEQPLANVDEYGIYRNFWTPEYWREVIFAKYNVVDEMMITETKPSRGTWNSCIFAVSK